MKKLFIILTLTLASLKAGTINVAVAANVSYAIEELKKEFAKTHPDTKVQVTLSSSGKLTAQIKNGAPYGMFMSANMKYPNALYSEGLAITEPKVYAQGALAMLTTKKLDLTKGLEILTTQNVKKVAIANPQTAPYGKAALDALKKVSLLDTVEKKFVYAESISQAVTYSVSAADIGFIAKSSLYSPKMSQYKEGVNYTDVDTTLYSPIEQGIVLLRPAQESVEYRAFYEFMLSENAKKIFRAYGYIVK
ncbi:MAG: molybdate ABC transporter substrate-binding protein [Campylobacterales bacterium]|nr:molybdate ABC transporter substrate-binding protein [Campylobacterales bacterium]